MNQLAYEIGALLYTPANNASVASHIIKGDWTNLTSICLCLEDSIQDKSLAQAELQLVQTIMALRKANLHRLKIFVRVKSPDHLYHIHNMLGEETGILTGYILPKFDMSNANYYLKNLSQINGNREVPIYAMPILESPQIANKITRIDSLRAIREILDNHRKTILNIRVGGNDFCNLFGLRRSIHQTIYDLGVVRDILVEIVNIFSDDYVVSGPVWEYYGKSFHEEWARGLRRELELDLSNGFFGKTAIHPIQLPIIHESLKVSAVDAADAQQILHWTDSQRGVAGNSDGSRMNEVKCHKRWAERMMLRAELYGIRGED